MLHKRNPVRPYNDHVESNRPAINAGRTAQRAGVRAGCSEQAGCTSFAGTVTELDSTHITVSRSVLGRPPEHRTFIINSTTKMSKDLRTKERVTVRYSSDPDGDVALEILVRTRARGPRSS